MQPHGYVLLAGGLLFSTFTLAQAQEGPADKDAQTGAPLVLGPVEVIGGRQQGSVIAERSPIALYDSIDIQALGASSIEEIIELLGARAGSGRSRGGRPVILLNGRRIASFRDIRDLPAEAVERVEILPEDVALRYGYPSNQRVLNVVLRDKFSAYAAEAEYEQPAKGAGQELDLEGSFLRLRHNRRLSLAAQYRDSAAIRESDRTLSEANTGIGLSGAVLPGSGREEIDPGLSLLAGLPVTSAAIPAAALTGAANLEAFAVEAGKNQQTSQQPLRSLQPAAQTLELTAALAAPVGETGQASVSLGLDLSDSSSLLGLPRIDLTLPASSPYSPFSEDVRVARLTNELGPLRRDIRTESVEAAFGLNDSAERWSWNLTSRAGLARSESETFRSLDLGTLQGAVNAGEGSVNPFSALTGLLVADRQKDEAHTSVAEAQALLNGRAFDLPVGEVMTALIAGLSHTRRSDRSRLGGRETRSALGRTVSTVQASLDLPVAGKPASFLVPGEVTLNLNTRLEHASDFGPSWKQGAGLVWRVSEGLRLSADWSQEEAAPEIAQLSEPTTQIPGQLVFDFSTAKTALVTLVDGGNPDLAGERRSLLTISAQFEPFDDVNLTLRGEITERRTDNPVAAFPAPTAQIEAAFPRRFVRDQAGALIAFDRRPENMKRSDSREWRWSLDYRQNLARSARSGRASGARRALRGQQDDQLRFSLVHIWTLKDRLVLADGLQAIDYLSGAAVAETGGRPEHVISLRASGNRGRFAARLDMNWQSATFVEGMLPDDRLEFSDLIITDARLSYTFSPGGREQAKTGFLSGARISITLDNILDQRLDVRDTAGLVPSSFEPDRLDARGRTIRLEFRKLLE